MTIPCPSPSTISSGTLHSILKKHWGYENFRPLQEDIIRSVLDGHDTLGLMPTGGGKSITFQVAGLAMGGLTIVVTPLVSLMKDQVDNLRSRRISAVAFHSGMTGRERTLAWERLINGKASFLYIAPERIANKRFINEIRNLDICQIVVDEAHCISQWGYDFRPSYLNICNLRKAVPGVPILALTATATPDVAIDIARKLNFSDAHQYAKSFARNNLSYIVRRSDTKINDVSHILSNTQGSAIVYVRSRRRTREIAQYLQELGHAATYYHAGLDHSIKEERQNAWKDGRIRVIVATNAFGMGIDKPDVRCVIHYDIPPSLEEYYQEAGRAGRDGLPSYAVALASPDDSATLQRRLSRAFPPREFILRTYERACIFMGLAIGEGYDTMHEFDIARFCANFKLQTEQTRAALHILGQAGYLQFEEEARNRSRVMVTVRREELYSLPPMSEDANVILKALLRTYPGLFMDYVNICESELTTISGMGDQAIYDSLLELNRAGVVSYIPKSRMPFIYVPTAREETRHVRIGRSVYEDRIEIMRTRINSISDYIFNNSGCRVSRMLRYFGEQAGCDCGKCDICREHRPAHHHDTKAESTLAERICSFTASRMHGVTLPVLARGVDEKIEKVASVVNFLCGEGFLVMEHNLIFSTSEQHQ